jgi:N-methylhydantoinase A
LGSKSIFRFGIDIGGTFTDGVLVHDEEGTVWIDKVLTTLHDPSLGFLQCLLRLAQRAGLEPSDIDSIIHATTIATNALLERRGARAGLLVTKGFRDILEIARQVRYELYNLQTEKPRPLIPRDRCFEVSERLNYRGEVQLPLDEQTVASAVQQLRAQQVDSIAVCFLHSYQNATHEKRAAELIRELHPEACICVSSEVAPEIREYWRASTTVTNAYIGPVVSRYLNAVEGRLHGEEVTAPVRIMQSSGGIMTLETAKQWPVYWPKNSGIGSCPSLGAKVWGRMR